MASSYTGLGTELMTTGENAGTWGTTTNTNLQIIEQMVGGYVEQAVTTTTTLSVSDGSTGATLSHRVIKFTGTLSANATVTIPLDVQQMYILLNGTAGAYTLTFKYVSGSGSTVAFAATDKGTKIVYATADDSTDPNMVDTGISSTGAHDLDGNEFILDADADTSITADTDDQIDIKIAGADDFQFTANTFTAQSGSTIAAQALTATTVTASGIVKTDDTTAATSTTDGSLQTDGGLSVAADAVIGDDLKLLSDSAILSFGADSDTTLTHTDGTGLTLNSTNKLLFGDTGTYIHQSADGVLDLVSDTEIEINATTIDINGAVAMDGAITGATNITLSGELDAATLDISGNADIDGTTNLDAVDIDGAVQLDATLTIGANDQGYDVILYGDTASANVTWDTSADDLIFNGGAGLIVPDGQLTLGSTAVSSTAAELNLLDTASANSVVNSKAVIYGSSGELAGTLSTAAQTSVTSLGTLTALTVDDVAVNGKVVTMTGSTSDTAVFTAGTNGTLSIVTTDAAAAAANIQITADGTVDIDSAGVLTLDSGAAINIEPAAGSAILLDGTISVDAGVVTGATSITSTAFVGTLSTAAQANVTSLGTLTTLTVDNVITNGATIGHTSDTDLMTLADGVLTVAGELDATTLDISGNADIDGTTNLDAVDIDGAVQLDATLTVGADDQGYDIKFFGDTASAFMLWDTSTDDLVLGGAAKLYLYDAAGGEHISSDGSTLSIAGGGEIDLTATAIDINGTCDISGTFSLAGTNVTATAAELNYSDLATLGTSAASKVLSADSNNLTKITGGVYLEEDTLTFDATQDWDVRASPVAKVTLTANVTFDIPTNPTTGQYISIVCIQDGTGSRTIAWNGVFEFASDTAPTATTTAAKGDMFTFRYNGSKWLEVGRNLALTLS